MTRKRVPCPVCSRLFHSSTGCGCCGFDNEWEYKYCCESCWRKSEEYNKYKNTHKELYLSLTVEQKEKFIFIQDKLLTETDYEYEIEEWMKGL